MMKEKYNRWEIIKDVGVRKGKILCLCRCDCGVKKIIHKQNVTRGLSKSCGCYNKEVLGKSSITHHEASLYRRTKEYRVWIFMKVRCLNRNAKAYKDYGGRGIKVCKRWMKYENFLEDMGRCPEGFSLDRINNDDGYHKDNCRWTDKITQANNTRSNRLVFYNGKRQSMAQWCREIGLKYQLTIQRINRDGWSIDRAFSDRNDRSIEIV